MKPVSRAANRDTVLPVASLTQATVPIIAGHSHSASLGVPLRGPSEHGGLVALDAKDMRFCGFTGAWRRTSRFWQELATVGVGRTVVLVWSGNQHNALFLLSPTRRFDFVLYEDPALPLDPGADLVPDLAVQERLSLGIGELEQTIELLTQRGVARILVAGTPPPKGDTETIRNGVRSEPAFRSHAEKLGVCIDDIPLSSPILMHKLWSVVQRVLRHAAIRGGAEFVPVPAASLDRGLLREDLSADDATHANAEFGRLMRDELYARIGRPRE